MLLTRMKYIARKNGCLLFPYSKSGIVLIAFGIYDESKTADGICFKDRDGNCYIFYNDSLDKINQAFAIAHELGHIKLHHKKDDKDLQQEDEADRYAIKLLNRYSSKLVALINKRPWERFCSQLQSAERIKGNE